MDPTNNPTPTPTPEPTPTPAPEPNLSEAPVIGQAPDLATNPVVDPVQTPTPAPAPVVEPTNPIVNPVVNPTDTPNVEPVNPVFQPTSGVPSTDPIMMPEPAKVPDPIEEELKSPMKAAEPVPGSIGSAVSGPNDGPALSAANPFAGSTDAQTPNISFTDPAMQSDESAPVGGGVPMPKKKTNRTTLIALIAVAAMVVIALAAVLIIQLINNNSTTSQTTPNNPAVINPDNTNSNSSQGNNNSSSTAVNNTLSCTRNMTQAELIKYSDAISGMVNISAEFDDDNQLSMISLVDSVVYSDEDTTNNEPVENVVHESEAADLTAASALNFYLPVSEAGTLSLGKNAIQSNYESLDFTCEAL